MSTATLPLSSFLLAPNFGMHRGAAIYLSTFGVCGSANPAQLFCSRSKPNGRVKYNEVLRHKGFCYSPMASDDALVAHLRRLSERFPSHPWLRHSHCRPRPPLHPFSQCRRLRAHICSTTCNADPIPWYRMSATSLFPAFNVQKRRLLTLVPGVEPPSSSAA